MLLTHNELKQLVNKGVIENVTPDLINSASIDLTLGFGFQREKRETSCIDLSKKETVPMDWIEDSSVELVPGDWCLATTQQRFHLPDGIMFGVDFSVAAEYKLKSSMARSGLNHLLAGWCDPGWNNAELTLELHNINKYHSLKLCSGMKIGQIVLWRGEKVPDHASYAMKGRYNHQTGATPSKGVE